KEKRFTLTLSQTVPDTPGQKNKKPMHIPVAAGLLGPNGDDLIGTQILHLTKKEDSFTVDNIGAPPVPSILRGFSAPVRLTTDLTDSDLRFLMVHDSDGFNRWEAGQTYALRTMDAMIGAGLTIPPGDFLDAAGLILDQAVAGKGDK